MPYYRRYNTYRKKRTFKRRRRPTQWYNKKYSVAQAASAALKGVNYIRGLVNSEMFKYDQSATSGTISNTGAIINLVGLAQGDSEDQRTGNSIYVRHINASGMLAINASGVATSVRVMLVIDKQQLGDTTPSVADILEDTGTAVAPYSKLNALTVGRFSVLSSRVYMLNADRPSVSWFVKRSMRHHVRYNGPANTDIQRGGLYLVVISNEGTNTPSWTRNIRTSYHDN